MPCPASTTLSVRPRRQVQGASNPSHEVGGEQPSPRTFGQTRSRGRKTAARPVELDPPQSGKSALTRPHVL
jgi:hypothetical protein